jgi:hypothetical protein
MQKEVTMQTMLLIIAVALAAMVLFRPAPRSQVIYVPVEVSEECGEGLGCLPLIVVGIVVLVALGVIRF